MANNNQRNNKDNDNIKEVKINMTVENKAFLQLVCTSKGISTHQYINSLIDKEKEKSKINLSDVMAELEKL